MSSFEITSEVVGREAELQRIGMALDALSGGPVGLVIEGEAGIGKTTLWRSALLMAAGRSLRVLSCRPSEPEATFSFSGLTDLLQGEVDVVLRTLPQPQARALEVALLRVGSLGPPPDQRTVSAATLGAIKALSDEGPLVIAVDDVQWLDRSTARVLEYVVRRMTSEPIALLASRRTPGGPGLPLGLEKALAPERLHRFDVGPLSQNALYGLVVSRLGLRLSLPLLRQLHQVSGGNPFFALEIASTLDRLGGSIGAGEQLPVPTSLSALVADRISKLRGATREAVVVASALSKPTVETIRRTGQPDRMERGLDRAAHEGILEIDGNHVRFAHPLLASVAYASVGPGERGRIHSRLSLVVDDPEERGRHLALAARGGDEDVATELDDAARHARNRGAVEAAAELAELARNLTPLDRLEARWRRSLAAADLWFEAGDMERCRTLAAEVARSAPPGNLRAEAHWDIGWVRSFQDNYAAGAEAFRDALAEAEHDLALTWKIEYELSWASRGAATRREHAVACLQAAERIGDAEMCSAALGMVAYTEFDLGLGLRWDLIERALRLMPVGSDADHYHPIWWWSQVLIKVGDLDAARTISRRFLDSSLENGYETGVPNTAYSLAEIEWLAGDWDLAEAYAAQALEAAMHTGRLYAQAGSLYCKGLVEASRGDMEAARASALAAVDLARADRTQENRKIQILGLMGFIELSVGDAVAAHRWLGPLVALAKECGIAEPALQRFVPDEVEALVAVGDLGEAKAVLDPFEEAARRLDRAWALAVAGRCRGLISAALGDLPGALGSLEEAITEHGRVNQPFELGRTLLVKGEVERRAKRKRAARESLNGAVDIFDSLGARPWSRKAMSELERIGGRAPAPLSLTPTEARVADLAGSGRTNREIADLLFISVDTVKSNLKKVYAKLGVRSRTELARIRPDATAPTEEPRALDSHPMG